MSNRASQVAFPCPFDTTITAPTSTISFGPFTPFPTAPYVSSPDSTSTSSPIPGTSFEAPHETLPYGKPFALPPGTLPNFASPPTLAPAVIGVNIAFITLSCVAVSLRIWGRRSAGQKLWSDDWLILVAWIMAFAVSFSATTRAGTGRHVWDIPPDWITADHYPQAIWLMTIFFVVSGAFIKLSLLIFYHRFSASNSFRLSIYAAGLFVVGSSFSLSMAMFFICLPIEANWIYSMRYDPGTKCLNMFALFTSGSILNAVAVLVVWLLPIPIIVRSKMSKTRKMHVYSVLMLGGLVVIASFVRVYLVVSAEKFAVDYGWKCAQVMIASAIEVNIGIIVACLPAIKSLLTRYFPMYFAPNTKSFQVPPSNEAWTQMWRKFIPSISSRGSKYTFEHDNQPPKYEEGGNAIVDAYGKREFYAESVSDVASTRKLYGQAAKETGGVGFGSTNNNGNGNGGGGNSGGEGWFSGNTWNSSRSGRHGSIRESNIPRNGKLTKIRSRDPQSRGTPDSEGYLTSMDTPGADDYRPRPSPVEPAHLDIDKWPGGKL